MYDLIISDIDGCLSPEDSSPLNVEKLSRIADHNRLAFANNDRPKLTLCTGRPIPFAEGLCRLLQNSGIPCVAENGVWLYDPSCNGYLMDPSITDQQLQMVHEAELFSLKTYRQEGLTLQPGKSASVTLYHPDPAVLQRIAPQLQDEFDRNGFEFRVSLTLFYINCDLPQITKASGIDRLLERTGVDASRTARDPRRHACHTSCHWPLPANLARDATSAAQTLTIGPHCLWVTVASLPSGYSASRRTPTCHAPLRWVPEQCPVPAQLPVADSTTTDFSRRKKNHGSHTPAGINKLRQADLNLYSSFRSQPSSEHRLCCSHHHVLLPGRHTHLRRLSSRRSHHACN